MINPIDTQEVIICPDCHAVLPGERLKDPWCECGWSSIDPEWSYQNLPPAVRRMLKRSRKYAPALEKMDQQAAHLIDHPWGGWLWRFYLGLTLLICTPLFAIKIIWIGLYLAGWGYSLYSGWAILIVVMILITIGYVLYRWLTRPEPVNLGISLTRETSVKLYETLDEVAKRLNANPINSVRLQFSTRVGVRQKFYWRPKPHFKFEMELGILSLFALSMSQFKLVSAHELGHVQQKDTVTLMLIQDAITNLQDWAYGSWDLFIKMAQSRAPLAILVLPIHWILITYLRVMVWIACWAMRRQEYTADRIAVQHYGKLAHQQSLIALQAVGIGFADYLPLIKQKIENHLDLHDFFYQFADIWNSLMDETTQKYYAKAVASFSSVYDTHPSYRARLKFVEQVNPNVLTAADDRSALEMLPNAAELGRELTIQILQNIPILQ